VTTIELHIRNGEEIRTLTAEGANYDAAKAAVDAQVPEGWQKLLYYQR
jgi:hypothetical protein